MARNGNKLGTTMDGNSRREFVRACLRLTAAGLSWSAVAGLPGCARAYGSPAEREEARAADEAPPRPAFEPPYVSLQRSGELRGRGERLYALMESCELCPRACGAARLEGERGFCGGNADLEIAAFHPHFGEERPLVGRGGSGTIFLSNCGLRCVFCVNWEISQGGRGEPRGVDEMAAMMLRLQETGCHNVNIVTPTHYSAHVLLALDAAAGAGLRLPLVWNTCGWERLEVLKLLDGVVDIYLPDFKYSDGAMAAKYSSGADSYPEVTRKALLEMQRQVGVARPAADGLMYRGLMIRHLVMPNDVSGSFGVIDWIARSLPKETYVNIMSQYRPMYRAGDYPEIARRPTREEYERVVRRARAAGLSNLDIQGWRGQ